MADEARRRMRRIATDRPATEAVVVRVIIEKFWYFLLARSIRGRSLRNDAARQPNLFGSLIGRLGVGSRSELMGS